MNATADGPRQEPAQETDESFFRIDPNGRGWVSNDMQWPGAASLAVAVLVALGALIGWMLFG